MRQLGFRLFQNRKRANPIQLKRSRHGQFIGTARMPPDTGVRHVGLELAGIERNRELAEGGAEVATGGVAWKPDRGLWAPTHHHARIFCGRERRRWRRTWVPGRNTFIPEIPAALAAGDRAVGGGGLGIRFLRDSSSGICRLEDSEDGLGRLEVEYSGLGLAAAGESAGGAGSYGPRFSGRQWLGEGLVVFYHVPFLLKVETGGRTGFRRSRA